MKIEINTEFIKVSQLLKLGNIISNGSEAKFFIMENEIIHNGVKVTQRGKKIYKGEFIKINQNDTIEVI